MHTIFVTSKTYSGALEGLSGADAICTTTAISAGLPPQNRPWKAILSSSTTSAVSRILLVGPIFNNAPTPAKVMDVDSRGKVPLFIRYDSSTQKYVGRTLDNFTRIFADRIDYDENGNTTGRYVGSNAQTDTWTGSNTDGKAYSKNGSTHCENWTSEKTTDFGEAGTSAEKSAAWMQYFDDPAYSCDGTKHIYCISQ